jgi:lipopolysaccharide assembly outer membrane protein LptD (OstA)
MIRSSILATAGLALTLALATGCDKAADDQQKANKAQEEANTKITSAKMEAAEKGTAAQAEADKKIAAAEGDFGKRREEYAHKVKADVIDLDKKIDSLEAKAKTATGKTKADLDLRLVEIRTRRAGLATDLKSIETATAVEWDKMKVKVDKDWNDLKGLVDKAD